MIRKIGVIGAGQMGNGIAHVCALAGYSVVLIDISQDQLKKAQETIRRNLDRQLSRNAISETERAEALARIETSVSIDDLGDADLVIEAATEDEQVKRKIFVQICPKLKKEALIATNTSSISVTRLASVTDRPEKFMGMHFMNPVP
ncbi:MAG: NAD(P)-binding domain-containing protein, partial [Alphaproteobacteria bacterium]|nr:NAD(P)-binding domain-containing protein [Alphaproteobacteria bacterium]